MRKNPSALVLGTAAAAASLLAADATAQASPNVIVIIADDAGYADWGFMDGVDGSGASPTDVPTPNLDALASRGVKFSRAYVGQSCQPTRAALVTGGYQQRIGNEVVGNNVQGLPADATTIWDRMGAQGYTTGAVGKWHLGSVAGPQGNRPETQGVDEFYGIWHGSRAYNVGSAGLPQTQLLREAIVQPGGGFTDTVVETAHSGEFITNTFGQYGIDFIANHYNDADPFFLYQSFTAPHTPLIDGPDFNDPSLAGLTGLRKQYASNMLTMDKEIGRILDRLDDPNGDGNSSDSIADNTLIVFVNDNGGAHAGSSSPNGADNGVLRAGKGSSFEGGIRVPMIIAGAGVDASVHGTTYSAPVHGVDILPTAVAAAGGTAGGTGNGIDGVNLLPFINGTDTANPHDTIVNRHRTQFALIKGDMKLVWTGGSVASPNQHQLYDLAADVSETSNIAGANPALVAELQRDLTGHEAGFDKQRYAILGQTDEATINTFDHFTFRPDNPAPGEVDIINGPIGNGDFEDKTGAAPAANVQWTTAEMPHWHNLSGDETQTSGTNQGTNGSPQAGSYGAYIFPSFTLGNDSGHTINSEGEVFDLAFALSKFGAAANYDGDEDAVVTLFTSSTGVTDGTVLGDIDVLVSESFNITDLWTNEASATFYTSTAGDVGKTVFLGITLDNPTGNLVFPRIDVVDLAVTTLGSGGGGVSVTNWSGIGAWVEGGTSNVETMFHTDAFAGAVLEFTTTDTFSYVSNNDMTRSTGLEFMLNKVILSGTFSGTQNQSATIQGNAVLFTKDLDGVGPQLAIDATNGGGAGYTYDIDTDLVLYDDLTITGDGDVTVHLNGQIRDYFDPRSLTKTGSSTAVLNGNNTYTGDTTVEDGTLSITQAYLENTADVYLTAGALFDLNFAGIDIIDELFFDGTGQATGTWGAIGSGAQHESALFKSGGTGMLRVSTFSALLGDYNNSGLVEQGDLDQVLANWGQGFAGLPASWVNQRPTEGIVDQAELDVVLQNWGSSSAPDLGGSNVPEPASLAILSLTGLTVAARRRRSTRLPQ